MTRNLIGCQDLGKLRKILMNLEKKEVFLLSLRNARKMFRLGGRVVPQEKWGTPERPLSP